MFRIRMHAQKEQTAVVELPADGVQRLRQRLFYTGKHKGLRAGHQQLADEQRQRRQRDNHKEKEKQRQPALEPRRLAHSEPEKDTDAECKNEDKGKPFKDERHGAVAEFGCTLFAPGPCCGKEK